MLCPSAVPTLHLSQQGDTNMMPPSIVSTCANTQESENYIQISTNQNTPNLCEGPDSSRTISDREKLLSTVPFSTSTQELEYHPQIPTNLNTLNIGNGLGSSQTISDGEQLDPTISSIPSIQDLENYPHIPTNKNTLTSFPQTISDREKSHSNISTSISTLDLENYPHIPTYQNKLDIRPSSQTLSIKEEITSTVSTSNSTEDLKNNPQLTLNSRVRPSSSQTQTDRERSDRETLENLSNLFAKSEFTELIKCDYNLTALRTCVEGHEDDRQFCINLFIGSSLGYHLLKDAVRLPNISTLLKNIPITTDVNHLLMQSLHTKVVNMTPSETQCIIVVDSMPITPTLRYSDKLDKIVGFQDVNSVRTPIVAEKAVIMMARGMLSKWQQPVGYALLSHTDQSKLANWITTVIMKLSDIGFTVRVLSFASKIEADFFEKRSVSIEASYFFVKIRRIDYISDPNMLLDLLRSDWSQYDICYRNDNSKVLHRAKYDYIKQFYDKDKNSPYRLAPNLTDSHINPTDPDKNDAVEIFSKTVASGLSAYIDHGEIDEMGRSTVEVIVMINKLFTLFNNNDILFRGDQSHVEFLRRMLRFFRDLKWVDQKNGKEVHTLGIKSEKGLLMNIRTYLRLTDEFRLPHALTTRSEPVTTNKGMTDKFFKQIRLRTNDTKPTAEQFEMAYKQLFVLYAKKPLRNRINETDYEKFFMCTQSRNLLLDAQKQQRMLKNFETNDTQFIPNQSECESINIPYSDYSHIDRTERHTLVYISGFLLKKCKEYHKDCQLFKCYADGISEHITINHFTKYLTYSLKHKISLMAIPCNHFVIIVGRLEEIFRSIFKKIYIKDKIEQKMYTAMKMVVKPMIPLPPCPCFPWEYFVKLFIRLRIFYTIMLNNREIGRKRKDFVFPLLLSEFHENVRIGN